MLRTRTFTALVALLLITAAVAPAAVLASDHPDSPALDDTFDEATLDHAGPWTPLSFATPDDAVTYGANSTESWHVWYTNGSMSSLKTWANSSDARAVLRTHNDSNYALVQAPASAVGVVFIDRLLDRGLAANGYVTSIALNEYRSYAAPVGTLKNESGWTAPGSGFGGRIATAGLGEFPTHGIAFNEDANVSTISQARNVTKSDQVNQTGSGIKVAVIDTGANTLNGEIFGNGSSNSSIRITNASKDFIDNESVNATAGKFGAVSDGNGHGTWVASAIAANTTNSSYDGYAPDADLLVLKALDDEGRGSESDIAAAIRHAADNNADIISMSLGSPQYSVAIADAIDYAFTQNVSAVVVAAGNSRQTTRWVASPADADQRGVISVAASNTTDHNNSSVAYFSQLGPDPGTLDGSNGVTQGQQNTLSAPGMKVEAATASANGARSNTSLSGTSMATPQVAGALAQVLEAQSSWQGDEAALHDRLINSSRPMPNAAVAEAGQGGLLAVDNLNDSWTPSSQASRMDTAASARQDYWEGLSDRSGGVLPLSVVAVPVAEVAG